MSIAPTIADTIGDTPLVALRRISESCGVEILVKLESRNPAGSVKDRVARALVDDAERRGVLRPGATLVEPTSGNTGIALAMLAAVRGYRLMLALPEAVSQERVSLLRSYGAEVILTAGSLMGPAVAQAEVLARSIPGAVQLRQFDNPANPAVHEHTTAPEIWRDTDGKLDHFVAGIGTGGTITGVGRFLRRAAPRVRVVGVEPSAAAVLSGGVVGHHRIQGIGAGFVPKVLDRTVVDEVIAVDEEAARSAMRRAAREDGVLAGISSGAALAAALELARRPDVRGHRIVVIFPDGGERYLSSPIFSSMVE